MKVGIIGLGWFGWPLAKKLLASHQVHGTATSDEKVARFDGIKAYTLLLDPDMQTSSAAEIFDADSLVVNIPPKRLESETSAYYHRQIVEIVKAGNSAKVDHLIFISSTGVFGDHQERVDEDTVPEPTSDSGAALVNAENYLKESFVGRVSIIRPGGLVGEDRHPARFLAGRKGISGKLHPVNLVHRADLISITRFLIENQSDQNVFHAVAEQHPSKEAYYTKAAIAMGLAVPEFDDGDISRGKYIDGTKSQIETKVNFKYNNPCDMY
jgi:nucleoside-diphosphate-sugar epimerase